MNNPNFSSSAYTDSAYLGNLPQNPQASNATNPNTAGGLGSSQYATPSNEKVQRFNSWHSKQGIATPQDYPNYASQPDPFSTVPRNPLLPTAASPYLQKVGGLPSGRPADSLNGNGDNGAYLPDEPRRKPTLRRAGTSGVSPPTSGGAWPKSMFGSKPPTRTRSRHSATPDFNLPTTTTESNAPPLASFYDDLPYEHPVSSNAISNPLPCDSSSVPAVPAMTPTGVKVSGFSEDRFPDVVRKLRRYYGPILEAFSGLSEADAKFTDPEIIPREMIPSDVLRKIDAKGGTNEDGTAWVRVTFRDREAADACIRSSQVGELVVGGRRLTVEPFNEEARQQLLVLDQIDVDVPVNGGSMMFGARRGSGSGRRGSASMAGLRPFGASQKTGGDGDYYSQHIPGAKIATPKPVAFKQKEGWLSTLTGGSAQPQQKKEEAQQGQGGGWGTWAYKYLMDDVIGFKYL